MATSGRQSALFGVQDWKRFYQVYSQADFQSYDYETLRKNFIDYLTAYYPETFNDYIESSEFVALLDVMAFMGQALAFRNDLNTRENFIDTAERRDSVIKLANLVSYTPKRNIAAQGLLKATAISTTESVFDVNGTNLSNSVIMWNDPANPMWQEQFNAILNASLVDSQRVGRPGNTNTILGVKTDEYAISIPQDQIPVAPFRTEVDGTIMNFELVNVTSLGSDKLYEPPPASTGQFNIVYQNDGLGYGSVNTGFFFYFKQGTLQSIDFSFAEAIENNFQQFSMEGINDTDTWMFGTTETGALAEQWTQVDNIYVSPNLQSGSNRTVFSVSSRFNDQVTYNYGDGIFGEIPVGTYRAYMRSSNALTYTISPSEMQGLAISMRYISRTGVLETLTFTLSLQTTVNTAQGRESILRIKERAPSRYYTQNRMVNGEDYSNFPFATYNSIIKSIAVNRSSIGISRNLDLLDPTAKYSSTNVFGDDGALYTDNISDNATFSTLSVNLSVEFLSTVLPVLLAKPAAVQYYAANYPRYSGYYSGSGSVDNRVYWKATSVVGNTVSGYFYILSTAPAGTTQIPVPVGSYSSANLKYVGAGAQLRVVSPPGYYFDVNSRLVAGTATAANSGRTFMWVAVSDVIGDGYNYGDGAFTDGTGPVKLAAYIPSGCYIDTTTGAWNPSTLSGATGIIPSFDNTLSTTVINSVLSRIATESNFALKFDNSLPINSERWSTVDYSDASWFVRFAYNSINRTYLVTVRNANYYWGSVDQVRFTFDEYKAVYDPKSGLTLSDYVGVFKTNGNPTNTGTLGVDYTLNITDLMTLSDGYPDDYRVRVSSYNTSGYTQDPDFFAHIVGTGTSYVFFQLYNDVDTLVRSRLLPQNTVIYAYATRDSIVTVMYEYPTGTVFYATGTGVFYQTTEIVGTVPPVLQLNDVSTQYVVQRGRGGLNFQYRHNSPNTTRIDPGTTNIVDLYVVTQSYYTAYQNWINDTTGTVPHPSKPTMDELQQLYGGLNDYKMMSDSVVLNSVTFKPLFGTKAAPELRGTIKVIKNPAVTVSDSVIRSSVLQALNSYFTLDAWDFGDTFYFSELSAYLHVQLAGLISSVVLVPADPDQTFGDLYEVRCQPNEIFVNGATTTDIIVIAALTPQALQRV